MDDRLITRSQLINFICDNSDRRIFGRIAGSSVVVLGGFSRIPPSTLPGWIVKFTSQTGRTWLIAVLAERDRYKLRELDSVPYESYIGDRVKIMPDALIFRGDFPEQMRRLRDRIHQ